MQDKIFETVLVSVLVGVSHSVGVNLFLNRKRKMVQTDFKNDLKMLISSIIIFY